MEALLLGIYSFFVWLIFIKFKWLPWNITSKTIVVIIPIVALTALILTLNVVAPSTSDVRVVKYVVQVVPQVRGRVVDVPVEPNRLVKKGDLLFKIDPTPYKITLDAAKAKLAADEAQLELTRSQVAELEPQLKLNQLRVRQNRQLVKAGAGDKFALEQVEASVAQLQAQLITAKAKIVTARAVIEGSHAAVADAQWNLDQTAMYAPADGYAINVQLRPGSIVVPFPVVPAMTFVENEYVVLAMYSQNELRMVKPGNEAEFALRMYPGKVFKATVDSIVWAQGQGQITQNGALPNTGVAPGMPNRFPVKFKVDAKDSKVFLAAGAAGSGAIYTDRVAMLHIIRKVIVRVGSITDYLILKLH